MKRITYKLINTFNPCYDPIRYISECYDETLVDFLKLKNIPARDRLWVIVRHQLLTDNQLHHYGLACARLVEKHSKDIRVKQCNDITAKFLKSEATLDELSAAAESAWSAELAAESAARSAWSAARSAAESAARSAELAARSARSAAESAESAAWSAEKIKMEEKQCLILIKILKKEK